jgi:monoterpene epsilon-lactone hydrolase
MTDRLLRGIVNVPAFHLPLSSYLSEAARQVIIASLTEPGWVPANPTVENMRAAFDANMCAPRLVSARALYPGHVETRDIGGVRVDIVTPADGVKPGNENRLLINMHGGGFRVGGGGMGGQLESLPIAAVAGMIVATIDYRLAPDHPHPAALDDVEAVYRSFLKEHAPGAIGLYGCSAGGVLAAMAAARFQRVGLPAPGALGLFCAGAEATFGGGDSVFTAPPARGMPAPPSEPNPATANMPTHYIGTANVTDAELAPAFYDEVLASFPPVLLLSASRDFEMSAATWAHRRLLAARVDARLVLWDGLGHGFIYDVETPEAAEAFGIAARFFDDVLAR